MRVVKLMALGSALALAGGLLGSATGAAAAHPKALPAAATRVVSLDVDGDAVPDTVTVEQSGPVNYVVNVVTAAGHSDVAGFSSTIETDWGIEPWLGAARMDRVKGHELLLATSGGDGYFFRVLSWRAGGLAWQKAPRSRMLGSYDWYVASPGFVRYGYRFSTVAGRRYVRDFELYPSGSHWKGTVVKSVWRDGAWRKVSTRKVDLSGSRAAAWEGVGVTLVHTP